MLLATGTYHLVFQCTACIIGTFDFVASQGPTVTSCDDIWFSENSEDMASLIVATGVSCTEAESVIREVDPLLGPTTGLDPAYAQGFECSQMFQSDEGLPSATYQCTRGSEAITFVRT